MNTITASNQSTVIYPSPTPHMAGRKIEDPERGKRLLLAHSLVDQKYGRHLANGEYGELIAKGYKRRTGKTRKFNHATVREWQRGEYAPDIDVYWVIGELSGIHPSWLAYGDESGAPGPLTVTHSMVSMPRPVARRKRNGG